MYGLCKQGKGVVSILGFVSVCCSFLFFQVEKLKQTRIPMNINVNTKWAARMWNDVLDQEEK